MRGGGSPAADRDAALRLTFGLIVRMYAYDDALQDLAEQDPICLEAFAPQVPTCCTTTDCLLWRNNTYEKRVWYLFANLASPDIFVPYLFW